VSSTVRPNVLTALLSVAMLQVAVLGYGTEDPGLVVRQAGPGDGDIWGGPAGQADNNRGGRDRNVPRRGLPCTAVATILSKSTPLHPGSVSPLTSYTFATPTPNARAVTARSIIPVPSCLIRSAIGSLLSKYIGELSAPVSALTATTI